MLNRVLGALNDKGWFDTAHPFAYSVNLTRGACVWLLLTRDGRAERYVKFSQTQSLAQEAARSQEASLRYPDFAPPFVGYIQAEEFEIIACAAVDALGFTPREVVQSDRGTALLEHLEAYFEAMHGVHPAAVPMAVTNRQLARPMAQYFENGALASLARRWLSGAMMNLALELPDMPQHCDFVLNNIARREPDGVVIFDWEDFGAAALPGLDLFTLELSLADDPARLLEMRRADFAALRSLKSHACRELGLALADYHALTPIYALVFRYLKRNYGPWVRERMDRLLLTLDRI
ncbi:MAG: hypothetical protein KIT60_29980 [Burkholderiaceae bacterium]|nr:hypothetical protein [Burkholderiaceae bacterium]